MIIGISHNRIFAEYNPPTLKTLGFMIHLYQGRDYLNIRYDDPVFIIQGGLTISLRRYNPYLASDDWPE